MAAHVAAHLGAAHHARARHTGPEHCSALLCGADEDAEQDADTSSVNAAAVNLSDCSADRSANIKTVQAAEQGAKQDALDIATEYEGAHGQAIDAEQGAHDGAADAADQAAHDGHADQAAHFASADG